jgi:IS4 transposase
VTKGAIKLHLLLDHEGYLPTFEVVTDARFHDVRLAQLLSFPPGAIVVLDRGYVDYKMFGDWTSKEIWFVTRMKKSARYRVIESREVPRNRNILADEVIELSSSQALASCPHLLRRIEAFVPGTGEVLVFLTNHLEFGASTIARIYKDRWQIELFFKALKQNLRIKSFVGTSANAVQIQIWTALIAMLLLKYLQFRSRLNWALSNLVALLRWNLFTYRDLWEWIHNPFETPPLEPLPEQLSFAGLEVGQHR